jgi:hypothetical protein
MHPLICVASAVAVSKAMRDSAYIAYHRDGTISETEWRNSYRAVRKNLAIQEEVARKYPWWLRGDKR